MAYEKCVYSFEFLQSINFNWNSLFFAWALPRNKLGSNWFATVVSRCKLSRVCETIKRLTFNNRYSLSSPSWLWLTMSNEQICNKHCCESCYMTYNKAKQLWCRFNCVSRSVYRRSNRHMWNFFQKIALLYRGFLNPYEIISTTKKLLYSYENR